jgi:hypothetical protein
MGKYFAAAVTVSGNVITAVPDASYSGNLGAKRERTAE